jgi:hypothetical protein
MEGCVFLRSVLVSPREKFSFTKFFKKENKAIRFSFIDSLLVKESWGVCSKKKEKKELAFYKVVNSSIFQFDPDPERDVCTWSEIYFLLSRQPSGEAGYLSNFGSDNVFFIKNKKNIILSVSIFCDTYMFDDGLRWTVVARDQECFRDDDFLVIPLQK